MVMALVFSLLLSTNILATDSAIVKENLDTDLTVEILEDGRVAPVDDTSQLSEASLDSILIRIGYPVNSINNWDITRKRNLASSGGKVINGYISDAKHEYISSDGKGYLVTPSNENEIRKIQIEDLKKAGISDEQVEDYNLIEENTTNAVSTTRADYNGFPGSYQDGNWTGTISIAKVGETSTQYVYKVSLDYYWSEQPFVYYGDNAGFAWAGVGIAKYSTVSTKHAVYFGNSWTLFPNEITELNNYGTSVGMNHDANVYGRQMGYIEEEITVSKSMAGEEKGISAAYSHPWHGGNDWSISVGIGGLSFSSGNSALNGDNWLWGYNFIVQ